MLDYLQNPPIKHTLMERFIQVDSPNYLALTPNAPQKIQQDKEVLNLVLQTKVLKPFSFNLESFYFFLNQLSKQFKVALILSSHKMLYEASLHFAKNTFIPLIPNVEDGKIPIQKAITEGADCFIVPYLNEDILTNNAHLDEILKPYFNIWGISYALALQLPLPKHANIYLAHGENLGLVRPLGIMGSQSFDNIHLINGQDYLFGFLSPSFVLQLMGYTQEKARELLSISFINFQGDTQKVAEKLTQKYLQLKRLGG